MIIAVIISQFVIILQQITHRKYSDSINEFQVNYNYQYRMLLDIIIIEDQNKMEMNKIMSNSHYKMILPTFLVMNWVWMLVGPTFFPKTHHYLHLTLMLYTFAKTASLLIWGIVSFVKSQEVFKKLQMKQKTLQEGQELKDRQVSDRLLHAYIIPNYKEDIELLAETIGKIAEHPWAKQKSLIFLAMEAHEAEAISKAQTLCKHFKDDFKLIGYTLHEVQPNEQKGKAANISWCVEHLQEMYLQTNMLNTDDIMLTIMDADSWVPEAYVTELQGHLFKKQNLDRKDHFIYQPNQIFGRNQLKVPVFNRCFDELFSQGHSAVYLNSLFEIGFPMSNYSFSYNLIKKIGFWDKDADSITEDLHTTQKAFWKTQGMIFTVPIFTPFNQLNLYTGKGYVEDIKAKFWQASRHFQAVADIAYNIRMFVENPLRFRTSMMAFSAIEVFLLPAVLPSALLSLVIKYNILPYFEVIDAPSSELWDLTNYALLGGNILAYATHMLYEYTKRKANTMLHKHQNSSIFRIFELPLTYNLNMILFTIPCLVMAAFKVLQDKRQYKVAQKVIDKISKK